MKKLLIFILSLIMFSCNNRFHIEKRQYGKGWYVNNSQHPKNNIKPAKKIEPRIAKIISANEDEIISNNPVFSESENSVISPICNPTEIEISEKPMQPLTNQQNYILPIAKNDAFKNNSVSQRSSGQINHFEFKQKNSGPLAKISLSLLVIFLCAFLLWLTIVLAIFGALLGGPAGGTWMIISILLIVTLGLFLLFRIWM